MAGRSTLEQGLHCMCAPPFEPMLFLVPGHQDCRFVHDTRMQIVHNTVILYFMRFCTLYHGYLETCITPYSSPGGSIPHCSLRQLSHIHLYNMRFFISSMVSCRSPLLAISVMMSHPPSNSPLTYSWGNVGQSNIFFSPCRTSSSDRMSKVLKGSWVALRAATTRWLKPHLGSSGAPV